MAIFDDINRVDKQGYHSEVNEEYKQYSKRALEHMHRYASWRVYQLDINKSELTCLADASCQLGELMNYARRIERTEKNERRFKRRKEELEYEIMRRKVNNEEAD